MFYYICRRLSRADVLPQYLGDADISAILELALESRPQYLGDSRACSRKPAALDSLRHIYALNAKGVSEGVNLSFRGCS
jgi:hypothetical protein